MEHQTVLLSDGFLIRFIFLEQISIHFNLVVTSADDIINESSAAICESSALLPDITFGYFGNHCLFNG
nr:hypothetical protein [Bacillus sp. mrc49]